MLSTSATTKEVKSREVVWAVGLYQQQTTWKDSLCPKDARDATCKGVHCSVVYDSDLCEDRRSGKSEMIKDIFHINNDILRPLKTMLIKSLEKYGKCDAIALRDDKACWKRQRP